MIGLIGQAKAVQDVLEGHGWPFCFIGGIAVLRWGEPRATKDIDVSLFTGFGDEPRFVDALLANFAPRIADARAFALANRVALLQTPVGDGLDIALAGFPFEREMIARSSKSEYLPGIELRTCSAEDLIVTKAFAARGQDWVDVTYIAVRQAGALDWPSIYRRLTPLVELKEEPEILDRLRRIEAESRSDQ